MDLFAPVQTLTDWFVSNVLHLQQTDALTGAVNFFIYDSIKIFILLVVIIFAVSIIRSFISPERTKALLSNRFEIVGNILAALIGIVTPFCSCSAVPLFIGLVESGVPLGVTFSYLISAPMVNEVAAVLLFGLFGFKVALLYITSGVTIAIVVGYLLGRMKLEHLVESYVWTIHANHPPSIKQTWTERMKISYRYTASLIKKVFPYVLLGVAAGALVHGYAPENLLAEIAGKK